MRLEIPPAPLRWGIVSALSQSLILWIIRPLGVKTFFELQVSFSRDFHIEIFQRWLSEGVFNRYLFHLYPDLLHPLWYGMFLISVLAFLLKRLEAGLRFQWLLALPVVAGLADYVENAVQFIFLSRPNDTAVTDPLVFVSSLASCVKWGAAAICLLAILVLIDETRYFSKRP